MSARQKTLAHLQKLAAAAATVTACKSGGGSDKGYAVVDPMPMPPRFCFDPAKKVRVTAAFVEGDKGKVLEVRVELRPETHDLSLANAKAEPYYNAEIVGGTAQERFLVAQLRIKTQEPDQRTGIGFAVRCDDGTDARMNINIDPKKLDAPVIEFY